MPTSNSGRALERALSHKEAAAEREFWEAFHHQNVMTEEQFRTFLQAVGRPLTWRIWNIAIDEVDRLALH
ncbi:MAG: hypothetical protein KC495_13750 [Dehalococcoidia bacterium]|nr:hypothetical protein [Dehalococcoidia bacterium]